MYEYPASSSALSSVLSWASSASNRHWPGVGSVLANIGSALASMLACSGWAFPGIEQGEPAGAGLLVTGDCGREISQRGVRSVKGRESAKVKMTSKRVEERFGV